MEGRAAGMKVLLLALAACAVFAVFQAAAADEIPEHINQLLRTRQYAQAVAGLETLADQEHIGALRRLAKLYRVGRGVEADVDRTIRYLRRAAELGDAESQLFLGKYLAERAQTAKELDAAAQWIESALRQGYPGAASALEAARRTTVVGRLAEESSGHAGVGPPKTGREEYLVRIAAQGDLVRLRAALVDGITARARDRHGRTALAAAIEADSLDAVELLIASGADVNTRLPGGNSALLTAVKLGRKEIVGRLVSAQADVNVLDDAGNSPLIHAVRRGDADLVELLIASGAEVDRVDARNRSVLDNAMARGDGEIAAALRAAGAAPRAEEIARGQRVARVLARLSEASDGAGLIFDCIRQSNHELLARVIDGGADLAVRNDEGYTPLVLAVLMEDRRAVDILLRNGASIDAADAHGLTPVHRAIDLDSEDILGRLLRTSKATSVGVWRDHPLHYAIRSGRELRAIQLIEAGHSPYLADRDGYSAIEIAVRHDARSVLGFVERSGPGIAAGVDDPGALFELSVEADSLGAARFLSSLGGDYLPGREALSALLVRAAGHANPAMLRLIVEAGADVDYQGPGGVTALMAATARGCVDCIDYLLERGANPDIRDELGNTALHVAALNGAVRAAMRLVEAGANQKIRNRAGESHLSMVSTAAARPSVASGVTDDENPKGALRPHR